MKTSQIEIVNFTPRDELERLELQIAQRADNLSREEGFDPHNALANWRQAEREILGGGAA